MRIKSVAPLNLSDMPNVFLQARALRTTPIQGPLRVELRRVAPRVEAIRMRVEPVVDQVILAAPIPAPAHMYVA